MHPSVRAEVRVAGEGGVSLAADVYRPRADGDVPTILIRTPYGKSNFLEEGLFWARHGLACVVQDVRGRFESGGNWWPYLHERDDAKATADWLCSQPWSDGRIIPSGSSYGAFTAWSAALAVPDLVRGVISRVPAMGLKEVKFEVDGVLRLAEHVAWWLTWGDCRTARPRLAKAMVSAEPDLLAHLPVIDLGSRLWADVPGWSRVLDPESALMEPSLSESELAGLDVPALHIGGWHDPLLPATLRLWGAVGADRTPRPRRSLLIGPWPHQLTAAGTTFGHRDFGPTSRVRLGDRELEWVQSILCRESESPSGASPVQVFVMVQNRWVDLTNWPPPSGSETILYAASANTLQATSPRLAGSDTFRYDPRDPYPSRVLPVDRSDLDNRQDIVRYTSPPLEQPLVIAGEPHVVLTVHTDCDATDFIVRLVEELPDGRILPISRGCLAVEQAYGHAPGTGHVIPMTPTALMVRAGHRIRLDITSSDFPELARNLNTGQDRYRTSDTRVAHQSVFYGGDDPTRIILPTGGLA